MKIIFRQNGRSLSSPRPRPVCGAVVVAASSSSCPGRVRVRVRGLAKFMVSPQFCSVRVCGQFAASSRSRLVRVRVRDSGHGAFIARLFRDYFAAAKSFAGEGVGLALG